MERPSHALPPPGRTTRSVRFRVASPPVARVTFDSLLFAAFLAVVVPLYLVVRRRVPLRNTFLLLASYVFYAAWDWRFLGLIALSTLTDYVVGRALDRAEARRRLLLTISVVVNLGLLIAFKYFDFFAESFAALAGGVGWQVSQVTTGYVLPVGISFYTFQTLGYTIDVYRREQQAEKNLLTFALFVAFFPQLVAGPIERAKRLLPQLREIRPMPRERVYRGFFLIWQGLFKKVVIADNLARFVDGVFASAAPTGYDVWLAAYAFAIQIYCDFSGYTDMARGTAKLLGFELTRNFDQPYFASGPQAFWRRWHMSLGSWFRDYLYVPLGGGQGSRAKTARNVLIVFALGGLWHGAAWTFVVWGMAHGLWVVLARVMQPRIPAVLAVLLTFHAACLGWILFRAESLAQAGDLLVRAARADAALVVGVCLIMVLAWRVAPWFRERRDWVFRLPAPVRTAVYLVLWFGVLWFGVLDGTQFIYFQF